MTDYYIKITTEEPNDDSTWFKLNSSSDELLVLKKDDYTTLKGRVDSAVGDLATFISTEGGVTDAIVDILTHENFQLENARNSVNTRNIIDEYDNKYTYTSLKNALDSKADYDDVLSTTSSLSNAVSQNSSSIEALETTINKYSWKKSSISWGLGGQTYEDSVDAYYNDILVFLPLTLSIKVTGTGNYVNYGTLYLSDGDVNLRPSLMVIQELNGGATLKITSDGRFWIKYTKGKTDTISTLVTVMYPRRGSWEE